MRHRKAGLKLSRTSSHRAAMFRNMVTSLLKHDRIRTTDVKAKELRRWAENVITLAKRGDLHARRRALAIVREKDVVHKLFAEAAERFGSIAGGYTRIVKLGRRPGDAAPVSLVELVAVAVSKDKKKTKKKKKAKVADRKPAAAIEAPPKEQEEIVAPEKQAESAETDELEALPDEQATGSADEAPPAQQSAAAEEEGLKADATEAAPAEDAKKEDEPQS